MSVETEIDRITKNLQNAYAVLAALGAEMPANMTSDNLATTAGTAKALLYIAQALSEDQQAQARSNLGIPGVLDGHNDSATAHADIRELISQLSSEKASKDRMTLGFYTDGLVYLFVDGSPVGSGIELPTGGIDAYITEDKQIIFNNLPDGEYTLAYVAEDGTVVPIGAMEKASNVYYSVTNTLTNCTSSNGAAEIVAGGSYEATITADSGYALESVTVTMGGVDVSADAVSGGTISIANVTGNIVITAVAEQSAAEIINLAEPNTTNTTDASIWCNNARLGSDGTYRANTGTVVTNYIPCTGGILYAKGISISLTSTSMTNTISFWDANKGLTSIGAVQDYLGNSTAVYNGLVATQDENGVYMFDFSNFTLTDFSYVRLVCALTGTVDDVIITVNQPIV